MPKQLAIDFNRLRVRALEIEGSGRSPKVKSFASAEIPAAEPGEDANQLLGDACAGLIKGHKLVRDPAAMALGSYECTFREMDLPFSNHDQIEKVLKFEAESHLHMYNIDEVVVEYIKLNETRDGSHLLVMANEKVAIRSRVAALDRGGVDPQFADIHINALYTCLRECGLLQPVEPTVDDEEEGAAAVAEEQVQVVVECDHDVTHLLVVRNGQLRAARAIRLAARALEEHEPVPVSPDDEVGSDDEFVVLEMDDEVGEADDGDAGPVADGGIETPNKRIITTRNFFGKLRREIQRTLFPLGLTEAEPQVLVLGPACRETRFVERLRVELGWSVEVVRPFDLIDHDLDPAVAEEANAEGAAALGVALRLLRPQVSQVDFRQEDVRYAKKFDHLRVVLTCLAAAAFVLAFLGFLVTTKQWLIRKQELDSATRVAFQSYLEVTADRALLDRYNSGQLEPSATLNAMLGELNDTHSLLSAELGREGGIPLVPSGADCLNNLIESLQTLDEQGGATRNQQYRYGSDQRETGHSSSRSGRFAGRCGLLTSGDFGT